MHKADILNTMETVTIDSRGAVVIPQKIRARLGMQTNSLLLLEERDGRLILRPALVVAVEKYTPERRAEFILNNAIDDQSYQEALAQVRGMGLDPDRIPHDPPHGAGPRVS
jgi:AbrB family looped-hinge helix DNA binding protein